MSHPIHLQHWYPNVNIRIDPIATLVPKITQISLSLSLYIYTSVNPRISILVLDEAGCSDAELSGAVTATLKEISE